MLGRAALRLDAAFCAVAGIETAALASPLARMLSTSPATVQAAGAGTVAWAVALRSLSKCGRWRRALGPVAAANTAAALGLAVGSFLHPNREGRIVLGATGLAVGSIAAGQSLTRRLVA